MRARLTYLGTCLAFAAIAHAHHDATYITLHHDETYITLHQVPAEMPPMTFQSGYCCLGYDIDENGDVKNARVNYCTENYLAEPSKQALQKWKYSKTKKDGTSSVSKNLTTYMSYYLSDEVGNIIPNSNGFMTLKPDGTRDTEKFCDLMIS